MTSAKLKRCYSVIVVRQELPTLWVLPYMRGKGCRIYLKGWLSVFGTSWPENSSDASFTRLSAFAIYWSSGYAWSMCSRAVYVSYGWWKKRSLKSSFCLSCCHVLVEGFCPDPSALRSILQSVGVSAAGLLNTAPRPSGRGTSVYLVSYSALQKLLISVAETGCLTISWDLGPHLFQSHYD